MLVPINVDLQNLVCNCSDRVVMSRYASAFGMTTLIMKR